MNMSKMPLKMLIKNDINGVQKEVICKTLFFIYYWHNDTSVSHWKMSLAFSFSELCSYPMEDLMKHGRALHLKIICNTIIWILSEFISTKRVYKNH